YTTLFRSGFCPAALVVFAVQGLPAVPAKGVDDGIGLTVGGVIVGLPLRTKLPAAPQDFSIAVFDFQNKGGDIPQEADLRGENASAPQGTVGQLGRVVHQLVVICSQ